MTHLLWNSKVHYSIHNIQPLVPILTQVNPVHNIPPYFCKIHSKIIVPSTPVSFDRSLPFRASDRNFVCISHLSYACYMSCLSRTPSFDHSNNTRCLALSGNKTLYRVSQKIWRFLKFKACPLRGASIQTAIVHKCCLELRWHGNVYMLTNVSTLP